MQDRAKLLLIINRKSDVAFHIIQKSFAGFLISVYGRHSLVTAGFFLMVVVAISISKVP